MAKRTKAWGTRRIYEFIKARRREHDIQTMCRALEVTRSGYYAWLREPISNRAQDDARLLRLIRASFTTSHGIYGSPRVFLDLREAGETCREHRVARLMRVNKIRVLHGYRTRHSAASKPSVLIPNLVKRNFDVSRPNNVWVTDITLYSHVGGMALPRHRHGPFFQEDRRLVDQTDNSPRARPECCHDGGETTPSAWNDHSFRPRLSIW
jgi:HTH-like domain